MRVPFFLVFHEIFGLKSLSDVVVQGGNSQKKRVRADCLGGPFAEGADGDAVIVCPRSLHDQLPDELEIQISEFRKPNIRRHHKETFTQREREYQEYGIEKPRQKGQGSPETAVCPIQRRLSDRLKNQKQDGRGKAEFASGPDEPDSLCRFLQENDSRQIGEQDVKKTV